MSERDGSCRGDLRDVAVVSCNTCVHVYVCVWRERERRREREKTEPERERNRERERDRTRERQRERHTQREIVTPDAFQGRGGGHVHTRHFDKRHDRTLES